MERNKSGRRGRLFLFLLLFAAAIVVGGILLPRHRERPHRLEPDWARITLPGFSRLLKGRRNQPVRLWFPGPDRSLVEEDRMIHAAENPLDGMRQMLILLLSGPRTKGLFPLFPSETALRELYRYRGVVFVDLAVPVDGASGMGCFEEALALESIRRTLKAVAPPVQGVRILINGREEETLAGHIALE